MNMKPASPKGIAWSGLHTWIIVGIGVALLGLVVSMTAVLEPRVSAPPCPFGWRDDSATQRSSRTRFDTSSLTCRAR